MFHNLWDNFTYYLKTLISSRLLIIGLIFVLMSGALAYRLFDLQIVNGSQYQNEYTLTTLKTVTTKSTRGNIYDCNGVLLAGNQLAYSVTVKDTGDYVNGYEKNIMLFRLVKILRRYDETLIRSLPLAYNEEGVLEYTTSSESTRRRITSEAYGLSSPDGLDDPAGKYPSQISADTLLDLFIDKYGVGFTGPDQEETYDYDRSEALDVINIRYFLTANYYQKYESITVARDIGTDCMATILESEADLLGVDVEEDYIRVYPEKTYLSHILGYTGTVWEDELADLQEIDPSYDASDIVGKTGIEAYMETELQSKKGEMTLYLDSEGRILEVLSQTDPEPGNDVYLTIDSKLSEGIYHLLEQQLAGILLAKIVNEDVEITADMTSSEMKISVKDAYYQLINNDVLDASHFADPEASQAEQEIQGIFESGKSSILYAIRKELTSDSPVPYKDCVEEMKTWFDLVTNRLTEDKIVNPDLVDTESETYLSYFTEEKSSLKEYLEGCIVNGWIDVSLLGLSDRYISSDETFDALIDYCINALSEEEAFDKTVYKYLINENKQIGKLLCLALVDQGALAYDQAEYTKLLSGGDEEAYEFLMEKIRSLEITPAQLALNPCTASAVLTDPQTGKCKALVCYPSYDNNYLSGNVDVDYYEQITTDLSSPLYNTATQTRKAPGSVLKPITAIAALEEGIINEYDVIEDKIVFTEVGLNLHCWFSPNSHGMLTVVTALQNSCNYFFAEVGYRMCLNNGSYDAEKGLDILQKYAAMFGLGDYSGVEITESLPQITEDNPIPSAIGQGSNAFANIHLARYLNALANEKTVYNLSVIDRVESSDGESVEEIPPSVYNTLNISTRTWDVVREGMRRVITDGSVKGIFEDCMVEIAGKTGTAEENKLMPNHANFISYAPYNNPEVTVSVTIPFGYGSENAAEVAREIYDYYYGYIDLDDILTRDAKEITSVRAGD